MNPGMNVELHIERLVLDGVDLPHGQRDALHDSVRTELARLLGEGGLAGSARRARAVDQVRAPSVRLTSDGTAAGLGRQVAGAIYDGLRS
jgi:hypothetical protein